MEIIPSVRTFIELHIDEIDNDMVAFLVNTAALNLTEYAIDNMLTSFREAEIAIDSYRKEAILILLDICFENYSTRLIDEVKLIDWLPDNMRSFLGYSYVEIREIVARNANRWKHIFTLIPYEEDNCIDMIMEKV